MTATIQLGIDLGELEDEPESLYRAAHIAYIAGGGHAGDSRSIAEAVRRCVAHGTVIGAHPGFDDRARFGRVDMDVAPAALRASVFAQCEAVRAAAASANAQVRAVKLHGALYHRADRDEAIARAALEAARDALGGQVVVVCWPRRFTARIAAEMGLLVWREAFADRGVRADGSLIARGEPGALLATREQAIARAQALIAGGDAEALCVHGDHPKADAIALAVRATLDQRERDAR